jgi:hypothetical protein
MAWFSARFASFLMLLGGSVLGQETRLPAPNAWMKVPTDLPSTDEATGALRAERDSSFDKPFLRRPVLTAENASSTAVSEGAYFADAPEIPAFPDRAVVIGTFKSSRSVLSASGHCIYTELQFQVDTVFDKGPAPALAGSTITIAMVGGTVRKPDGEIISFLTQPRAYSIQPGGTYLAILEYRSKGQYYALGTTWDLSEGLTKPNSPLEKDRTERGKSTLVGLSKDQLIQLFTSKPLQENLRFF